MPLLEPPKLQYISDSQGNPTGVIVPIDLWQEIEQDIRSERETAYLLSSPVMKKRLLDAIERSEVVPVEVVRAKLGL